MSKKDNNINNVDEADVNINDTDVTSDTDKDADTVEAQGSSDADVKAEKSDNASDAQGAEETVDINNKKDQKDAVIEDLQDRLKRQMAEFDNYRKRTDKEKSAMFEMGASDVVKKLLPIVDNFERGFKSVTEEELQTPFAKGMDMVYKQLVKALVEFKGVPQELNLPSAPKQFIQYLEEDNRPQVTEDVNFENGMGVSIGRLREDTVYDWKFIGLSHNTVRGAAGGAVLCAETLKAQGYIQAK